MDILEIVRRKKGAAYVSDLAGTVGKEEISVLLKSVDMEKYTMKQWNDALGYLLGKGCFEPLYSLEEISNFLNGK